MSDVTDSPVGWVRAHVRRYVERFPSPANRRLGSTVGASDRAAPGRLVEMATRMISSEEATAGRSAR